MNVINKLFGISQIAIFSLIILLPNCKKEVEIIKDDQSINGLVEETQIPQIPQEQIITKDTQIEQLLIDGKTTNCKTFQVDRIKRIESFDYLYSQDQSEIWPGSIVQSKYLREDGRLISIGSFPRDEMQYNIRGTMGSKGFILSNPTLNDFNNEMNSSSKLFWFMPPIYTFQKTQTTYSTEQGLIDLGINYGFLRNGLKSSFQISNVDEYQTMYLLVKSIYFNVSVDYPSKPSDFFGNETDVERLKRVVSADNSPAYISNVSYGRFALVKVKSSSSQQKTKLALDLFFKGLSANFTAEQKKIIENIELTVEAAPGTNTMLRTVQDVYDFINEGYQFNHRTGYVPVGYEARYLKDNSPLITHTFLSYKVISCL
jgi:hypothetical protein